MIPKQNAYNAKYLLLIGFSLMLALLIALTIISVVRMQSMADQLERLVKVYNAKTEYAQSMYNASRERALHLHQMLMTDDPFVQDNHHMAFLSEAANFLAARNAYQQLELTSLEQKTLQTVEQQSKRGYSAHSRTIELLLEGRRDEAHQRMLTYSMPIQESILKALDELLALQKKLSAHAVEQTAKSHSRARTMLLTLGTLAFLIGLLIAWFVVSRIGGIETMLVKAKQAAEDATRMKSDFLANMSHEIRTPLNAIIGMGELLESTELNVRQRDYVETIRTSGNSLLTIINDILDFSKVEAGMLELDPQPFDLRRCIEETLDLQAGRAEEKHLELLCNIAPDVKTACHGDVSRLRQILLNLLSNAVKFTSSGEVMVRVENATQVDGEARRLHFSVQDTGMGIPEDRINQLFTPFMQGDASTARQFGGTGLGLAICRHLCELMAGSIRVESTEGRGTVFHFVVMLPVAEELAVVDDDFTRHGAILNGKRVLLVEDNNTCRDVLYTQLSTWGMQVESFTGGTAALAALWRGSQYDLAVIDMYMPGMNGWQLREKIHSYTPPAKLPVILFNSFSEQTESVEGVHILNKPVKFSQLFNALVSACGTPLDNSAQSQALRRDEYAATLGQRYPLKILLAEDNLVNQKVALLMLQKLGYQADVANNGLEVLTAVAERDYDLILMDVQMPKMDGLTAARQINTRHEDKVRPMIIAMSAAVMKQDVDNCMEAGMEGHIGKPVQVRDLAEVLRTCYRRRYKQLGSTPELSTPTREVIHADTFAELRSLMGGDPLALKDFIDTYLQEAPNLLEALQQAIVAQDRKAVMEAVRALKSKSASLGARHLALLCTELEEAGRLNRLQGIGNKLKALENELEQVTASLPALLVAAS